jgi:DNA-binding NtrC family response regulator
MYKNCNVSWSTLMNAVLNKILVVDDEEDLTWSISKTLMRDNELLEIICVNSGEEALKVLKEFSIDLVISDVRMPGVNGLDLLEEVKKSHPHTKMIIMTAFGTPDLEDLIKKTKNVYYIEKPFDLHELKKIIFKITWDEDNYNFNVIPSNLKMYLN